MKSCELNKRLLRTLYFNKDSNTLSGVVTNEITQNGFKYDAEIMHDFVKKHKALYLIGGLERGSNIFIKDIAGIVEDCSLSYIGSYIHLYVKVQLLDTIEGKVYSTLANSKKWLNENCFTLNGIGEISENGIIHNMIDMRLYIDKNGNI